MSKKYRIEAEKLSKKKLKVSKNPLSENGMAAWTHYVYNHKTEEAECFKSKAIKHIRDELAYKYDNEDVSAEVAEEALQYMLPDIKNDIPFPGPKHPKFTFIDLFAGIGGFRLAMQNLGGRCVYTSEWDKHSKITYAANFGEVPFGDITKEDTKKYIPDDFDVLCAGFPCQAFSIAGRRGGFEDTRGTLFF